MLSDLIGTLERSFEKLSTNRFLLIGFFVGVVLLADYVTGFSFYHNIDSQIDALQSLQEMSNEGLGEKDRIRKLYDSVLTRIEQRQGPLFPTTVPILESLTPWLAKGVGGSYVFIIAVPIIGLLPNEQGVGFIEVIGGGLIAVAIFFTVSVATPTLSNLGMHFFVFTIIQITTFFVLAKRSRQNQGGS